MAPHRLCAPALIAVSAIALSGLACASIDTIFSSKPSLATTRTPWPTFTPAAVSVPLALATPVEPLGASQDPAPAPVSTPISPAASPVDLAPSPTFTLVPAVAPTPGEVSGSSDTPSPPLLATPTVASPAHPTFTPISTPTPTPIPESSGWSFAGVLVYPDQYEGSLLICGDLVNNSGSSQELLFITGTFYDAQGQVVADEDGAYGHSPVFVIPPGGRAPFELVVDGIQNTAGFDLRVEAQPSGEVPRQDFEFFDLYQRGEAHNYCIGGRLRSPGGELGEYLLIVATLYDAQDRVISFKDSYLDPESVANDQIKEFKICVNPLNQEAARYELQAWGQ